jgi:hypothetical protein
MPAQNTASLMLQMMSAGRSALTDNVRPMTSGSGAPPGKRGCRRQQPTGPTPVGHRDRYIGDPKAIWGSGGGITVSTSLPR